MEAGDSGAPNCSVIPLTFWRSCLVDLARRPGALSACRFGANFVLKPIYIDRYFRFWCDLRQVPVVLLTRGCSDPRVMPDLAGYCEWFCLILLRDGPLSLIPVVEA